MNDNKEKTSFKEAVICVLPILLVVCFFGSCIGAAIAVAPYKDKASSKYTYSDYLDASSRIDTQPSYSSQVYIPPLPSRPAASSSSSHYYQTVYITKTGEKYHRDGCRYLKSCIAIELSDAQEQGYTPCSWCW